MNSVDIRLKEIRRKFKEAKHSSKARKQLIEELKKFTEYLETLNSPTAERIIKAIEEAKKEIWTVEDNEIEQFKKELREL